MTEGIQQRLEELAREKLAEDEQYFLVDVKVKPKKKLQVFVDGDNGITIDKCAEISRSLEKELDEEGIAGNDYVLEVSSPGMNNPLKVLRQYKRRIGNEVEVVLYTGEKLEGILRSAEENHIALEVPMSKKEKKQAGFKGEATQQRDISFEEIKSTKIKYNI
ncbi:MAG: hypothetical protein BRD50_05070 [Bacteroidetes bacterium SW_11_45_7]|nr:MAG: hypothetical protein BRD50_05070 [Bacteroidetes bacterium SW_11_45_7]